MITLHINKSASQWPILARGASATSGQAQVITSGDLHTLRLYFWEGTASVLTNAVLSETFKMNYAAKATKSDSSYLFLAHDFTKKTEGDTTYYETTLNLNTTNLITALSGKDTIEAYVEIELGDTMNDKVESFQFKQTIRSQVIDNANPPEEILSSYPQSWEVLTQADIQDVRDYSLSTRTYVNGVLSTIQGELDEFRAEMQMVNEWVNGYNQVAGFSTFTQSNGILTSIAQTATSSDAFTAVTDFHPKALRIRVTGQWGAITRDNAPLVQLRFIDINGNYLAEIVGNASINSYATFDATLDVPEGAVRIALYVYIAGAGSFSGALQSFQVFDVATIATAYANLRYDADVLSSDLSALGTQVGSIGSTAENAYNTANALSSDFLILNSTVDSLSSDVISLSSVVESAQTGIDAILSSEPIALSATNAILEYEQEALSSKLNAQAYEAAAYTAMVNAGNSNKVASDDWRLGRRGGVRMSGDGTSGTALTAITPFELVSLSINYRDTTTSTETQALCGTQGYTTGKSSWYLRPPNNWSTTGWFWLENNAYAGANCNPFGGTFTVPVGTTWIHICYNKTTRLLQLFADDAASPFASCTRNANWGDLMPCAFIAGGWYAGSYPAKCTIQNVTALNFLPTQDERKAVMRRELSSFWFGGTPTFTVSGSLIDVAWASSGGTYSYVGGVHTMSIAGASGANALQFTLAAAGYSPHLFMGRKIRLKYTATVTTSGAMIKLRQLGDFGVGHVILNGANTVDIPLISTPVASYNEQNALTFVIDTQTAPEGCNLSIQDISIEILGMHMNLSVDNWAKTRGFDNSGNSNDLIMGGAAMPIEPRSRIRPINATAAGATITAGTVASIGAISGASYRDRQAILATRQWDGVSTSWKQARPANSGALQTAVTSNGTILVEASAHTGNATISANAPIVMTHSIN